MVNNNISVEIVYATTKIQSSITISVNKSTTARHAIEKSGILERFPEINLDKCPVGIFHQRIPLDRKLVDGDRIEIYRPLAIDPKSKRRIKEKIAKRQQ